MKLTLVRTAQSDYPTIGVLYFEGVPVAFSLELPWLNNKPFVSCIPLGTYQCEPILDHTTSKGIVFPKAIKILNVPNREGILIHPGNTVSDTEGCILLGLTSDILALRVNNSVEALRRLFLDVKSLDFELEITCPNLN